jgi:hypothetical protein
MNAGGGAVPPLWLAVFDGPRLDTEIHLQIPLYKKKKGFSITSKYRHIYKVLNVDEIKN